MEITIKNDNGELIFKTSDGKTTCALMELLGNLQMGKSFKLNYTCKKETEQFGFTNITVSREDIFEFSYNKGEIK